MEVLKGVEINVEVGNMEVICRSELRLEFKDGEVRSRKDRNWEFIGLKVYIFFRLVSIEININL